MKKNPKSKYYKIQNKSQFQNPKNKMHAKLPKTENRLPLTEVEIPFIGKPGIKGTQVPPQKYEYVYDANGMRVKKLINSQLTTVYHYDEMGNVIQETDGQGNLLASYIYANGQRIARVRGNEIIYYHNDVLGSPALLMNQHGEIVHLYHFGPFGNIEAGKGTSGNKYRFTGKEQDETGLYYFGARYYDPWVGRFITPDPVMGSAYTPMTFNSYCYAINCPLRYIDFMGLGIIDWLKNNWEYIAVAAIIVATGGIAGWTSTLLINEIMYGAMGAISAAMQGGDIGKGLLYGAIGGAVATGLTTAIGNTLPMFLRGSTALFGTGKVGITIGIGANIALQGAVYGGILGGISAYGGGEGSWSDIWKGTYQGAIRGAIASLAIAGVTFLTAGKTPLQGLEAKFEYSSVSEKFTAVGVHPGGRVEMFGKVPTFEFDFAFSLSGTIEATSASQVYTQILSRLPGLIQVTNITAASITMTYQTVMLLMVIQSISNAIEY
jgi:RHS repeat-associated protein